MSALRCCLALWLAVCPATALFAEDAKPPDVPQPAGTSLEELVARVRPSVVVVTFTGRDGKREGLGSGFIVAPNGLVATNLHVIGEARPISVQLADGRKFDAKAIHATDRPQDLALLKIDAEGLPALELGDSDLLKQGQRVIAVGNPLGLEHSVVEGIVSGTREIDGRKLIQLAIPIERGNSGGPLLDLDGRVHGLLTLKSLASDNLGFAVTVNALKALLESPNPIPMGRWLTIGTLDPKQWSVLSGARWSQRAGRIRVEGTGAGFGGRSLCLAVAPPPDLPFEVAVSVKLESEEGAAGLVFHADGKDRHYGFYPSNGGLRFSRFDGPDVFSWQVLEQVRTPHYRPGEWNRLKVRVEQDRLLCYVNDELVVESADAVYTEGRIGLAKFRDTKAEFKGFQVGNELPSSRPSPETVEAIAALIADISPARPPDAELIDRLSDDAAESAGIVLRERARLLERQAERLKQLALAVEQRRIRQQLSDVLSGDEQEIDLLHAALLVAQLDNPELDVEAYRREVERIAAEIAEPLAEDAGEQQKLDALNKHLFDELGFHGSRADYYNASNSYLNEVIDDREGLPITLSVLYIELARRIGLNVVGIGLPGHFIVRHAPEEGEGAFIDVFERGETLTREDAIQRVQPTPWDDDFLDPQSKKAIVVRMLRNLIGLARNASDAERMLRYVETLLVLDPQLGEERWYRAVLRFQTGRIEEAMADTEWLLDRQPAGVDLTGVRELQRVLNQVIEAK